MGLDPVTAFMIGLVAAQNARAERVEKGALMAERRTVVNFHEHPYSDVIDQNKKWGMDLSVANLG